MTPERQEKLLRVLHHRHDSVAIVLENVSDPHNISAVMRTAESIGLQDIYVLTTRMPRHDKWGVRSSSSAAKWLTVHQYTSVQECFAHLRQNRYSILTTHLAENAVSLYELDFTGRLALVFGNERDGVSEEVRAMADGNFIIPQLGIIRSLNISVACAVTLYEACRQKLAAGHYGQPQLPPERRAALLQEWGLNEEAGD